MSSKKRRNRGVHPAKMPPKRSHALYRYGLLIIITAISYLPSLSNEFTNWDDDKYVLNNALIRTFSFEKVDNIFSSFFDGNYHPLTLVSLSADYGLGGLNPHAYHLINLLLHILVTCATMWFLAVLTKNNNIALIASLLFGIHPLHVESVAWISERKDLLYGLFFFCSLIAYVKFIDSKKPLMYVLSLLLFVLSLLSKGQAVTLALTLIVIDIFRERPLLARRALLEKTPFFLLALLFGFVAITAQRSAAAFTMHHATIIERIAYASYGFVIYIVKLLVPVNLSSFYPYPVHPPLYFWLFPLCVIAVGYFGSIALKRKQRFVSFAVLFFAANIVFVLQFIPVGQVIMADRYTYVPALGIFVLMAWILTRALSIKPGWKKPIIAGSCVYGLLLAITTTHRCTVWHDSISLWSDVIEKHPTVELAYNNRGMAESRRGKFQDAVRDLTKAIELDPTDFKPYANRAAVYFNLGNDSLTLIDAEHAMSLDPNNASAYCWRACALARRGDSARAFENFAKALAVEPHNSDVLLNRAITCCRLHQWQNAISDCTTLLRLDPHDAEALFIRGSARHDSGDLWGACSDLRNAASLGHGLAQRQVQELCR